MTREFLSCLGLHPNVDMYCQFHLTRCQAVLEIFEKTGLARLQTGILLGYRVAEYKA